MIERQQDIATRDGAMQTFIVHPDRGGPFPTLVFFMDAHGIRDELRDMARRLATSGYYVMLPNLYYRQGVLDLAELPALPEEESRERMFGFMRTLTIADVMADADALLAAADADPAARDPAGAVGYCMSGQYAINFAARHPGRVAAAASIYGTFLVTDREDSPHRVAHEAQGEIYIGFAERDRWAEESMVAAVRESLGHKPGVEIEVYPGAEHGFAFPRRAVYNRAAADTHWLRLNSLFNRNLK
jgi:carboxymethylenebutenolidase